MPVPELPAELIKCILECIGDRRTLQALLCSSQLLRAETEPILYKAISFNDYDGSYWHLKKLHSTLASNPRLASYVREFSYTTGLSTGASDLLPFVHDVLRQLVNLKSLTFRNYTLCHSGGMILKGDISPYLARLTLFHAFGQITDDNLAAFLATHPCISCLELPSSVGKLQLSPHALLSLRTLHASMAFTASIPPEGTLLHWKTYISRDEPLTNHLLSVIRNVRAFSISAHQASAFALAGHMPNLEFLELIDTSSDERTVMESLIKLRPAALRSARVLTYAPSDDAEVILPVFQAIPSLDYMDLGYQSLLNPAKFRRWQRCAAQTGDPLCVSPYSSYYGRLGWEDYISSDL